MNTIVTMKKKLILSVVCLIKTLNTFLKSLNVENIIKQFRLKISFASK